MSEEQVKTIAGVAVFIPLEGFEKVLAERAASLNTPGYDGVVQEKAPIVVNGVTKGFMVTFGRKPLPFQIEHVDPGIRKLVALMRLNGFKTTDSGDGVSKPEWIVEGEAMDIPHVVSMVTYETAKHEALRLVDLLKENGVDFEDQEGVQVEVSYHPLSDVCLLQVFGVDDSMLAA